MQPIKVLIFDDNENFNSVLCDIVRADERFLLAGCFPDANNAVAEVKLHSPDVILMDIDMPGFSGVDAVKLIRQFNLDVNIIMLTVFDTNQYIFEALQAGASGYLLKKSSPAVITTALKDVCEGGVPITPEIAKKVLSYFASAGKQPSEMSLTSREREILFWLTKGYSYKMIAAQLQLSIDTVRFHIKHTYQKMQVNSAPEAIARALREKIV